MDSVRATTASDSDGLDLGAFVRGAAHDIANPLNAISLNAELAKLLLERDQPERARAVLERLLADCARCGRMVQGMQRFGSGLHAYRREAISARALIDAAVAVAAQERSGALPALRIDGVDAQISVDRPALERAIAGLLHNAAEAGATAIEIRIRPDGDAVAIDIRDNGGGIPVELRARVAEPFFTTRRAEGSSGLGLTLVHELLRSHGGALVIAENAGGGAHIELRLPQNLSEARAVAVPLTPARVRP
jgi:signal transduction histidine kinase